jgi:hypothetical protein
MTDGMDALLSELRTTAPAAPESVRARVEAIVAREPIRPLSLRDRFHARRLLVIAAPTAAAVMLGVALAHGLTNSDSQERLSAERRSLDHPAGLRHTTPPAKAKTVRGEALQRVPVPYGIATTDQNKRMLAPLTLGADSTNAGGSTRAATSPQPAKTRAQDYRATLTVRVGSLSRLSDATKAVISATRAWGGYVVSANYAVPGKDGDSTLTVRIPVQHVQAAIQRFSSLGTLAAQDVSIRDVQGKINSYTRQLLTIRERIAKIRARLTRPDLTPGQRASLELQLVRSQRAAAALRAERAKLARTASFATISLTLTTRDAAAAPHHDSRAVRTLRDAGSILLLELAFGLFALIVAAPLALLAVLALLAARAGRRRAADRLLGRA